MSKIVMILLASLCLSPWIPSAGALALGVGMAMTLGNPWSELSKRHTHRLLSYSVVGLGAGMNLMTVARVGGQGIGYTLIGISFTLAFGLWLARLLRVESETGALITVGTAICGGSAIAAIAPTLHAKSHSISVALGTVFLLNSVALLLFPPIGHALALSQGQFGLWSALAIHDTSSVVGSTLQYGPEALQIGTTVKLARALWIVPLTVASSWWTARQRQAATQGEARPQPKRPWFILGFLMVAALVTWWPELSTIGHGVEMVAKRGLVLTLFLIGANLTPATLKSVGVRPFVQGLCLWLVVASLTLVSILAGLIHT